LALGFPSVVDVELNEVLATADGYWQSFVATCAHGEDQALFLAEDNAQCVGMGQVRRQDTLARLGLLYVDGRVRRQGIGAALVAAQVSWAHASGVVDLVCHIPDASAGRQLAEELGWQRSEEVTFTKSGLKERKWTMEEQSAGGPRPAPSRGSCPP
jgi:GNAT superfamily N-acetyltransferase